MWTANGQQQLAQPRIAQREAIRLLAGVGGDTEWWYYNPTAKIGHLRVPLTPSENSLVPPGTATSDAGESGPQRPRTPR